MASVGVAVEKIGFRTLVAKVDFDKIVEEEILPFIAHWKQNHFVVVHDIKKDKVSVAAPQVALKLLTTKRLDSETA